VNPVGEFMINDDWAYTNFLETLREQHRLTATSWGPSWAPGGPAAIAHVLWGLAFTSVVGYSLTILRVSVLTLGILGSLGLLTLLRLSGASSRLALWGTLTLVFNPLFLSQCFTFMTDVTFVSAAIFSTLFLYLGTVKSRTILIACGLLFALVAILTRQLGIVIPLGFVAACFVHPAGRHLGRWKMLALAVGLTLIPWFAYEFYLHFAGSTPITQNLRFHKILGAPISKGFPDYMIFMGGQIVTALSYTAFLVSPVLALRYVQYLRWDVFRRFLIVLTAAFAFFEAAILTGLVDPPVAFYRNVFFDFGIGPIVLKDTYILGIERTSTIPTPLFYLLVYWTALAAVVLLGLMFSALKRLLFYDSSTDARPIGFLGCFSLLSALAYLGIILLVGFHDRYLIPVCALFIVWLVSDMPSAEDFRFSAGKLVPALVPLVFLAMVSVPAVRDFMEMKRSLKKAQDYVVRDLKVDPCNVDGGLEFNGYHCYRNDIEPRNGLSWWWVRREDYLLTLGPLPGYRVVRTFPFDRYIGKDGAVHVLQPLGNPPEADPTP